MTTITLPQVILADTRHLDAILSIMQTSFEPAFGEAWSAAQLAGTLALDGSFARRAIDAAGGILGFSLARAVAGEAELLLVAVDHQWRRRGIGRLLVEKVAVDAGKRGASSLFLEVRENNRVARDLYRELGFIDIGRRANYYTGALGERFAAITMQRLLFS